MGESAGGSLACLAGLTGEMRAFDQGQNLQAASAVQAVVDFYGITDFQAMRQMDAAKGVPGWALDAFLGDASSESTDRASAVSYVSKTRRRF